MMLNDAFEPMEAMVYMIQQIASEIGESYSELS